MNINNQNQPLLSCPCGKGLVYQDCCKRIHQDPNNAIHPEQLMRARYTAYTLGLTEFIIQTYHPRCHAEQDRKAIQETSEIKWQKLKVIKSTVNSDNTEGFVEFKAFYTENNQVQCLHERSRFLFEKYQNTNQWFYLDGITPNLDKIGRNDPCYCDSQKKFKHCCGK